MHAAQDELNFLERRVCLADNSVLAPFVDSGRASLLHKIVGCVLVAPSIIDPNFDIHSKSKLPEFNEYIRKNFQRQTHQQIIKYRFEYLKEAGNFWQQAQLSQRELEYVEIFREKYKRELYYKDGDLETLAIAKVKNGIILTNDRGLSLAAGQEGIQVFFPCRLLIFAVKRGLISCYDAKSLYNDTFVKKLKLYSKLRLECTNSGQPVCIQAP